MREEPSLTHRSNAPTQTRRRSIAGEPSFSTVAFLKEKLDGWTPRVAPPEAVHKWRRIRRIRLQHGCSGVFYFIHFNLFKMLLLTKL